MAIFLSFIYGVILFHLTIFFPLTGLILSLSLSLLVFVYFYKFKRHLLKSSIIIVFIFSISGFAFGHIFNEQTPSIASLHDKIVYVKGRINSQKQLPPKDSRVAYLLNIEVLDASTVDGEKIKFTKLKAIHNFPLNTEKEYQFMGFFLKDGKYLNPYPKSKLPIFYIISTQELNEFTLSFFEERRKKLNDFIQNSFSDRSSPFLLSITTGERVHLTKEINHAFNITGLAHILSISGTHFGLLFLILFTLFKTIFLYLPERLLTRLTLYVRPSEIAGIMTTPFLIFYLGISSLSIPTVRAFIMIILFLIGLLVGRKGFWLNTIAIAALIVVLIDPTSVLDLSAQLSFISVICIGLIVDKMRKDDQHSEILGTLKKENLTKPFLLVYENSKRALLISVAATVGTAPLVAYHFNYFSLVSPFTNLTITPLIGFFLLPVTLLSSMFYLFTGFFPLTGLIDKATILTLDLIEFIANFEYVDVKIANFPIILLIAFYTGLLVFIIVNYDKNLKLRKNIFSFFIPLVIAVFPIFLYASTKLIEPKTLKITFLDVGHGDASVVELPDERTIVIDTGRTGFQIGAYLKYKGINKIDALIITHNQTDHAGGVEYLLENFKIDEIWISAFEDQPPFTKENVRLRRLSRGDLISIDNIIINVLHPHQNFYTNESKNESNNYSLVLRIDGFKNRFLFTGDIEMEAQEDLSNLGHHLKSTVLKVPHHGSKTSAHESFFKLVSPSISIVSVGPQDFRGHPHEETLSQIQDSLILRTDLNGAIGIEETPKGDLRIKTCKEFHFKEVKELKDEIFNLKRLFTIW